MVDGTDPAEVGALLQRGVGVFTRGLRQVPVSGELSFSELLVLSRLDQLGPASSAEVARAEQVTPQAMSFTVAGLERRGLVERRPDPWDKRRVLVSLTAKGALALHGRRDRRSEQITKALREHFTPAELGALLTAAPLIERLGRELR